MEPDTTEPPTSDQPLPHYPSKRQRSRRKWPIVVLIAILLLAAATGYWYFKIRTTPVTSTKSPAATTQPSPPSAQNSAVALPSGTMAYTSTQSNLNLSFYYPSDWQVSPTQTTASGTGGITVTSPTTTITAADGSSVTGKILVQARAGGTAVTELSTAATAALDSTQIGYTRPTASQRQYPYLSYVRFTSASNVDGAFEAVIVTGGDQLHKGDTISSDGLANIDPLISATFYKCAIANCMATGAGTLPITNAMWQNNDIFQKVAAIFSSFKLN